MSNRVYDVLKWISILGLPVIAWLIGQIGPEWGLANVDKIVHTINAVAAALGALIGVSTIEYNRSGRPER